MLSQDPYAYRELLALDDPAGSEKALRALTLSAKATGDGPLVARVLCAVAHAQALQQRFEEAHETLNDADFILLSHPPQGAHARALLERGRLFLLSGLEASGRKYVELARARAVEASDAEVLAEASAL